MNELQTFALTNAFGHAKDLRRGNFRIGSDGISVGLSVNK
jgi:hypothetical protein